MVVSHPNRLDHPVLQSPRHILLSDMKDTQVREAGGREEGVHEEKKRGRVRVNRCVCLSLLPDGAVFGLKLHCADALVALLTHQAVSVQLGEG